MTIEENNIQQSQNDEISLKDLILKIKEIWRYLLSKWLIIVIIGVLGGALGIVYALTKEKEYTANLSFLVVEKGSPGGGLASLAGQFGLSTGSSGGGIFSGPNIIELLQSRNLIERTLLSTVNINSKTYRLLDYYREVNPPKEKKGKESRKEITYPLDLQRENFTREQDSLLYVLSNAITKEKLSVEKQKKDAGIVIISFSNKDELFAKLFTEILINIVSDFYVQTKTQTTRENLAVMELRADSLKAEYEKALEGRARLADRNRNAAWQIMSVEEQKYQTTIQLTGTAYAEVMKNTEVLKLDLAQQTPLVQIIDKPIMPLGIKGFGKAKGLIIGGFLGGFLAVGWLLIVYFYRRIMA